MNVSKTVARHHGGEATEHVDALKHIMDEKEQRIGVLSKIQNREREEIVKLERQLKAVTEEKDSLRSQVAEKEWELSGLRESYGESLRQRDAALKQIDMLKVRWHVARKEMDDVLGE